jgi:hypothetical protein
MKYAFSIEKKGWFLMAALLSGSILGTILINCLDADIINNLEIYSSYIGEKLRNTQINKRDFFKYILTYRIKEITVIIILGLTTYRILFHSAFLFYLAVKNSILISMLTIMKGKLAILWYIGATQPQTTLYAIIIYNVIKKMDFSGDKSYRNRRLREIIICVIYIVVMCLIESIINSLFITSKDLF